MIVISPNFLKKYDVALSFAEENRAFVDLVAQLLKKQGIKVFYDNDLRTHSWGKELKNYLDRAYRLQASFCVVFVSDDYERKRWTKFEIERANASAYFQKNKAYVLPYLMDNSVYTEHFLAVGCLTYKTHDVYQLAEAIIEKLNQQPARRLILWFKDLYRIKRRLAATTLLLLGSLGFCFKDQLTPVDILAEQLHQRGGHLVHGSLCNKGGWFSRKRGSGTCSSHNGVASLKDSVIYDKTLEECKEEAKRISLFTP
jgi:hypothetical protein